MSVKRVRDADNLADVLAKRVPGSALDKRMENIRNFRRSGRLALSPLIVRGGLVFGLFWNVLELCSTCSGL
jgi:hypothetical protein